MTGVKYNFFQEVYIPGNDTGSRLNLSLVYAT